MPAAPDALLARARQALEVDHAGVDGRLGLVSARYTTAVFTLHQPAGPLVLKLHADAASFAGETMAYTLLAKTAPVARLYAEGESSLSLLLEHLPEPADWTRAAMPRVLAERIAAVHTASLRLPAYAVKAMAGFSLASTVDGPAPAWITNPAAYAEVLAAHRDAYGPHLVPLGHLDLKPEHLRQRSNGETVLLDMESVRPDATGLIDLVTLPAVLRQAGHEVSPHGRWACT